MITGHLSCRIVFIKEAKMKNKERTKQLCDRILISVDLSALHLQFLQCCITLLKARISANFVKKEYLSQNYFVQTNKS